MTQKRLSNIVIQQRFRLNEADLICFIKCSLTLTDYFQILYRRLLFRTGVWLLEGIAISKTLFCQFHLNRVDESFRQAEFHLDHKIEQNYFLLKLKNMIFLMFKYYQNTVENYIWMTYCRPLKLVPKSLSLKKTAKKRVWLVLYYNYRHISYL